MFGARFIYSHSRNQRILLLFLCWNSLNIRSKIHSICPMSWGEIHSCSDPGSCAARYLGRRSDSHSNQFNVQDSERILDWNVVSAPYYSRRILSLGWIDIFDVSIALQLDQGRGTGQCITVPIIIKIEPVRRPEGYHYPMRNPARPKFSLLP